MMSEHQELVKTAFAPDVASYTARPSRRRRRLACMAAFVAVLVTSCGSGGAQTSTSSGSSPSPTSAASLASLCDHLAGARRASAASTAEGSRPLALLQIPSMNLRALVVEGVTPSVLRSDIGHFPTTPLPGTRGNVGLAGIRSS